MAQPATLRRRQPVFCLLRGRERGGVSKGRSNRIYRSVVDMYAGRMGERNLMRLRIRLLIAALMIAPTMSFGGAGAAFADPDCDQVPNNENCVVDGPGGSEDSQGQAKEKNPNVETTFKGREQ